MSHGLTSLSGSTMMKLADSAYCSVCMSAEKEGKLKSICKDVAFLQKGFSNWKNDTEGFCQRETSKCHIKAVQVMVVLPKSCQDMGEALSSAQAREKAENRQLLLKIFQNIKFLAHQGLPFRGQMMPRTI